MIPGVVHMHIETLEAVQRESKRLPPIQKVSSNSSFLQKILEVSHSKCGFYQSHAVFCNNINKLNWAALSNRKSIDFFKNIKLRSFRAHSKICFLLV